VLSIALSSRKVAAALAERLQTHAPAGIAVSAEDRALVVHAGGHVWAASAAPSILDDPQGWEAGEEDVLLESVAYSTMSGVQDAICEATAESWPSQPADPNALEEPGARVEDGWLRLWFGNPAAPLLALDPIALTDLA
jgi:hypothetical protein